MMRFHPFRVGGLVAACWLVNLSHAAPDPKSIPANDPRIVYVGRVALSETSARMGFPGISVRFVYRGPAPILKFSASNPTCFFNLSCNGWDPVILHLKEGRNEIALPTGVAPASGWLIEVVRRTESWMGVASFDGLELPAGCELLAAPSLPDRRLMFIGDSITCGEYNERFPPEDDPTPRSTNAARSYGMLLARWFGAQAHLIAYGGRGITRDWAGKTDVATVPIFFERTLPDEPAPLWDHSLYAPDVIAINIGTDFDASLPDEAAYIEAYASFVERVRIAYPRGYLLLCESGFQSDGSDGRDRTARDQLLRTMKAVVQRRQKAGDERIRVVLTGFHPGTPRDTHPVAFQHEQIALDLVGPLSEVTGWKPIMTTSLATPLANRSAPAPSALAKK